MTDSAAARAELLDVIAKNPGGHKDAKVVEEFKAKLQAYAVMDGVDSSTDVLFAIGSSV
eukprot:CAMPEP_0204623766 /NCGR_PEP_ID=MMETSP0717-20131115/9530_1 /ASSEMBLY_ACC=CAM_ASM_000666 /TAXON_ID=230516 /ORGANISM="Chaetoceros curvisetus" /LENGTH=58 /DNA_ID=CAMNT_0051638955 /DNA_START=13 /DNA_END=185 /DNA_ORIENTATION=-